MRLLGLLLVVSTAACIETTPGYGDSGSGGTGATGGASGTADPDGNADGSGGKTASSSESSGAAGGTSATRTSGTDGSGDDEGTSAGSGTSTSLPTTSSGGGMRGHRAFATSTTTTGDFGGVEGADDLCNGRARAANLNGTFVALISDGTIDARDRITLTGPVRNMLTDIVANDVADLWDGTIGATIDHDENAVQLPIAGQAWTGTLADGTGGMNCADWTTANNGDFGVVADMTASDDRWINNSNGRCSRSNHLYCVEQ